MHIGDEIEIVNYGYPNDEELVDWASTQDKTKFKITEIDEDYFYIEGCEYAIPFDSIDYREV